MEVATPVGYLCAAPRPGGAEERAHWHADLFLRSDVPRAMRDEALPEQIADWLLADTDCMEPLIVSVHEGQNTDLVERGRILDD